jgi:hypothetical protein
MNFTDVYFALKKSDPRERFCRADYRNKSWCGC